jgi:hypothetical protein
LRSIGEVDHVDTAADPTRISYFMRSLIRLLLACSIAAMVSACGVSAPAVVHADTDATAVVLKIVDGDTVALDVATHRIAERLATGAHHVALIDTALADMGKERGLGRWRIGLAATPREHQGGYPGPENRLHAGCSCARMVLAVTTTSHE